MIGEALRLIRVFYGYKAIELAKKLEISQSYLSEIENGKKEPNLELLRKYSKIFNLKVSTLLFFSEEIEQEDKTPINKKIIKLLQVIEKFGGFNEENS